jgi:capsular polysaccharide transport system permease protein
MSDLGELYRRGPSAVAGAPGASSAGWLRAVLARLAGAFDIWLWAFVFAPSLAAGVYYFGIASDLYMSEAKFIVRSASTASPSLVGAMLQTTGFSAGSDQASSVQDYILSRDAVRALEAHDHLREVLDRPGADFLSRFPNFYSGRSFEALFKHYADFVSVSMDGSSGVSTLRVKAYTREDARDIAEALLGYSEVLINRMNERQLGDTVATMQGQVQLAEERVAGVQRRLEEFRLRHQMLDPDTVAGNLNATLRQMMETRTGTQTQLSLLQQNSPASPEIPYLRTRLATLDAQIAATRKEAAGDVDSVATTLGDFEQLKLERELAEKSLSSATLSLEQARLEAVRHQLYIDRVVEPNLADYPLYPKRIVSFVMVVVTCLLGYGIAWLLIAGLRDHAAD